MNVPHLAAAAFIGLLAVAGCAPVRENPVAVTGIGRSRGGLATGAPRGAASGAPSASATSAATASLGPVPSIDAGAPLAPEANEGPTRFGPDDLLVAAGGVTLIRLEPEPRSWWLGPTSTMADFARLPPPFRFVQEAGEVGGLYWGKSRMLEVRAAPDGRIGQIDSVHRAVRGEWRIFHDDTAKEVHEASALAAAVAESRGVTLGPWPCTRTQDEIACSSPEAPGLRYVFRTTAALSSADLDTLAAAAPDLRLTSIRWIAPAYDAKTLERMSAVGRVAARQIFRPVAPGTKARVPLRGSVVEYVGAVAHTNQIGCVTAIQPTPCKKVASHSCVLIVGEDCPANRQDCEGVSLRVAVDMSTSPPSLDVAYAQFATEVATQTEIEAQIGMAP